MHHLPGIFHDDLHAYSTQAGLNLTEEWCQHAAFREAAIAMALLPCDSVAAEVQNEIRRQHRRVLRQ